MDNPDTLRALYAPGFAGWDSVGGSVTSVTYSNLGPNQYFLFAITAIDDAGDYDPVFSTVSNVLEILRDRSNGYRPAALRVELDLQLLPLNRRRS